MLVFYFLLELLETMGNIKSNNEYGQVLNNGLF